MVYLIQYPYVIVMNIYVDTAIFCDKQILLAKNASTDLWEFPGGDSYSYEGRSLSSYKSDSEYVFGLDGLNWNYIKLLEIVETENHITFLRNASYFDCSKWDLFNWGSRPEIWVEEKKYSDLEWFPVYNLPIFLNPRVEYIKEEHPQLFEDPHMDPNYIPYAKWYTSFVLPAGTMVWHGAHKQKSDIVEDSGYLSGETWTPEDQSHKTSGGTLDEAGLLWFMTDLSPDIGFRGKGRLHAESYARGIEAKSFPEEPIIRGKVFEVSLPRDMHLISRSKKLTAREAEILDREINVDYSPVIEGDTLSSAINKLFKYKRKGYAHALPLLGYDGISGDKIAIALLLDRLDYQRTFRRFI